MNDHRLAALRRFATSITVFNLLGHLWLGFEQAWVLPFASLATGYSVELLLATLDGWSRGERPRFLGRGARGVVEFLLPAHISSLAVAMLLFPNRRLLPIAFGTAVAIASKYLFRVVVDGRPRHVFNPSNLGIAATLAVLPAVGLAPPSMFSESLGKVGDWLLPAIMVAIGSLLNARLTQRIPLILAWLGGFGAQAIARAVVSGSPITSTLMPMTGFAFLLFSFYMISDPSTTPARPRHQVLFGAGVALAYGVLISFHVVDTIFFALSLVCALRGVALWWAARRDRHAAAGSASSGALDRLSLESDPVAARAGATLVRGRVAPVR